MEVWDDAGLSRKEDPGSRREEHEGHKNYLFFVPKASVFVHTMGSKCHDTVEISEFHFFSVINPSLIVTFHYWKSMISTLIFSAHNSMKNKRSTPLYLYCTALIWILSTEYTIYYTLKHYKFVKQQGLNSGLSAQKGNNHNHQPLDYKTFSST